MATIRVRDWTKERIEEIREAESHSTHDSVIKGLLKDRELAKFAGAGVPDRDGTVGDSPEEPETVIEDLTVLAEMVRADSGVLFLWCPNCGNEMAHLGVENPLAMSVFEAECQRCLCRLDQHAVVGIEIGYPVEQRIVDGTLESDLRECVVDYWDRTLRDLGTGTPGIDTDEEQFVWKLDRYDRSFDWDWPADVPVVSVQAGRTYRNEATDERIEVLEATTEHRNSLDSYRVRRHDGNGSETEEIDPGTVANLLLGRGLYSAE